VEFFHWPVTRADIPVNDLLLEVNFMSSGTECIIRLSPANGERFR